MSETEAQEAPTALELLDRLKDRYPSNAALIRALGVPRSSFCHWDTGKRYPRFDALVKIHRLAVQHGLIAPDAPLPRPEPRSEPDWKPELNPEPTFSWEKIIGLGVLAAALCGGLRLLWVSRAWA